MQQRSSYTVDGLRHFEHHIESTLNCYIVLIHLNNNFNQTLLFIMALKQDTQTWTSSSNSPTLLNNQFTLLQMLKRANLFNFELLFEEGAFRWRLRGAAPDSVSEVVAVASLKRSERLKTVTNKLRILTLTKRLLAKDHPYSPPERSIHCWEHPEKRWPSWNVEIRNY